MAHPFNMRRVRVVAPTSTGTISFTISGFGTPIAAMIVASWGDTADTLENGLSHCTGYTDGVDDYCSFRWSRDNVTTSVAKTGGYNDRVIALKDPADGSLAVSASFSQWVTDGIELNFSVANKAVLVDILLITGSDAEAATWFSAAPTGSPQTVSVGFQADVNLTTNFPSTDGTEVAEAHWFSGIATRVNPAEGNCSVSILSDDGVTTTETLRGCFGDRVATSMLITSGVNSQGAGTAIVDYTSTGFDVVGDIGISGNGPQVCGLAIKVGPTTDFALQIGELSPTSTGTEAKTWPGFFPGLLLFSESSMDGVGAFRTAGSAAIGSCDFVDQGCINITDAHNAGTTISRSLASSSAAEVWAHSLATLIYAFDVIARGSSGYTLDWTSVNVVPRAYHVLAIEFRYTITPTGIASAEAFGTPTLAASIAVEPTGIASAETFGTPTLAASIEVEPAGIASAEAFGTAEIAVGEVTLSPDGIASAEAFGTTLVAPGEVVLSPDGIASAEAFGAPLLHALIALEPDGIASAEAFGTATILPGMVFVAPGGIASAETFGLARVQRVSDNDIMPEGIGSAEAFGIPFVRGGLIPVTLKKRIYDHICEQIRLGTFIAADYDSETCTLVQGLQVAPASIEVNELDGSYKVDERHGRMFKQDYVRWQWQAIVRFNEEVICEPFERAWLEDPPCLLRTQTEERQARLLLLNAQYSHPPREGASNGTEARYHFGAVLSPQ